VAHRLLALADLPAGELEPVVHEAAPFSANHAALYERPGRTGGPEFESRRPD